MALGQTVVETAVAAALAAGAAYKPDVARTMCAVAQFLPTSSPYYRQVQTICAPYRPGAPAAPGAAPGVRPKLARYYPPRRVYLIYRPLSGALGVSVEGLGQAEPPPPPGYVKEGEAATPPAGAQIIAPVESPWYKRPAWLAAIGGGVVVLGVGTWLVMRRRRR